MVGVFLVRAFFIFRKERNLQFQRVQNKTKCIPVNSDIMKKLLSSCADCGEDKSILTQVGCAAEVIYLCSDCYNLKYSKEVQKEIEEDYLIPDFIKN